jgi:thiamine biosynthesis lipoprotein
VRAGRRLEVASGGTFNPAIGAAVTLWGFHTSRYPITEPPPSEGDIRALLDASPSMGDLGVDGLEVSSSNPAVRLDFSGLAKGFALGLACDAVLSEGIESALVNAGGDVMVCSGDSDSWRVAIRDPEGGVLETLEIDRRLAVFTSGDYHRYAELDGERYAHILDPRTARPVVEAMQATVIDADPLLADAAATALVAAGRSGWRKIARLMALDRVIVVLADGSVERLDSRTDDRR